MKLLALLFILKLYPRINVFKLREMFFNSGTMHEFKIKLLQNKEELFCTKAELLNLKSTLGLAKLVWSVEN